MASGTVIRVVTSGAFPELFPQHDGGLPPALGSALIVSVVLTYVFWGGIRGAAWANAFQTTVFMIIGVATFFILSGKLGGMEKASQNVLERNPSLFKRTVDVLDLNSYEKKLDSWKARAYSDYQKKKEFSRNLNEDEKLLAVESYLDRKRDPEFKTAAHKFFEKNINNPDPKKRWTRLKAEGIYKSKFWPPEKPRGINPLVFLLYLFIPLSVAMFPHLFQHWLTAKSAKTFRISIILHPFFIMLVWAPLVLIGAWASSAVIEVGPRAGQLLVSPHLNPNAVLVFLVAQLTNPLVMGLLTAGILAAIMSSLDSQFLTLANIFTNDIYLRYFGKKDMSEKSKVWVGRIFTVFIAALIYVPRSVFTLGIWCFSGFGALFPLILFALYWRRLTKAGAYAGILSTAAAWLYFFMESGFGADRHYLITWFGPDYGVMPVAVLFLLCLVSTFVVSLFTRPIEKSRLAKFFPE